MNAELPPHKVRFGWIPDAPEPYIPLSCARLAGPTVRDLVDALRLLDQDTKTSIEAVRCEGHTLVFEGDSCEEMAKLRTLLLETEELEAEASIKIERLTEELEALKGGKG